MDEELNKLVCLNFREMIRLRVKKCFEYAEQLNGSQDTDSMLEYEYMLAEEIQSLCEVFQLSASVYTDGKKD